MSKIQMREWSEEEYLLEHNKYNSNLYSNNLGDLPGSSSDKDVHHASIRMMGTQNYLRKSCYHRIECTTATFFAAFMCRRLLNIAVLTTITHKKLKRVSDETGTQVKS